MRFDCYKKEKWHKWYAWYPIEAVDYPTGERVCVWREYVWRKKTTTCFASFYRYELLEKRDENGYYINRS